MATEQVYVLFYSARSGLLVVNHQPITIPLLTTYQLSVTTGDVRGAGTDANVFAQIIGQLGTSAELALRNSSTYRDKFERRHTDVFDFERIESVGEVCALRVWHDNSGPGAGWHLNCCQLLDVRQQLTYTFKCNRWFAKDEDDGKIDRVLKVDSVANTPVDVPVDIVRTESMLPT